MDTIQAIKSRRAVKHFDENHKMTQQEINEILSLAMLSPTAFNTQNWRFVIVTAGCGAGHRAAAHSAAPGGSWHH